MDQPKPQHLHKREISYSSDNGHPWESGILADEKIYESSTEVLEKRQERQLEEAGNFLYGKSLRWYQAVAAWPMFILLVSEISIRVMQTKYLYLWQPQFFSWLIAVTRLSLFVYLAVIAIKQFRASKLQTIASAMLGGAVIGFLLAIFQLFWYLKLWTFFNLVGQPLLLAAEGAIISWLVYSLLTKVKK